MIQVKLDGIVVREGDDLEELREYAYGLAMQAARAYTSARSRADGELRAQRLKDGLEAVNVARREIWVDQG